MRNLSNVWEKEAFLGCEILYTNNKRDNFKIRFIGAETLVAKERYQVHFMCNSYTKANEADKTSVCGVNMQIPIAIGESIRFESIFGIEEEVTVEYKNEDVRGYRKFFPVKHIKFLAIEKDHIHYEVHCI